MSIDRIDSYKPSQAEEASRDERNRSSLRGKDPAVNNQAAQQVGKNQQTKETKSAFDQVLENLNKPSDQTQAETAKFDDKMKEILRDDDKGRDRGAGKEKKDEDKKTRGSDDKENVQTSRVGFSKDRIAAKKDLGDRGAGSNSGSFDSQSGSSQTFSSRSKTSTSTHRAEVHAPGFQIEGIQKQSVSSISQASVSEMRTLPKHVLDQIVQQIRVSITKGLNKEMHVDLSDQVFKGLSLKLVSRPQGIEVVFLTGNPDVRRLFEGQRQSIQQELGEKGIRVSQVRVQFFGSHLA